MLTLFVVAAMLFFLYVEGMILLSDKISKVEKFFSLICAAVIEIYYVLQLCERLGL